MRSCQKLFPREASAYKCILNALENFVIFSGKPDWLSPFLLMNWSCSPHLFKKGQLLHLISKAVVWKCSLKCRCFQTFQKYPGNHRLSFYMPKIKKINTSFFSL